MDKNELRRAFHKAYEDGVAAGMTNVAILVVEQGSRLGEEIAQCHFVELLSSLRAIAVDTETGIVEQLEPHRTTPGEIMIQAWPLGALLDAMQDLGCPQAIRDEYHKALSNDGNTFGMVAFRADQSVMIAREEVGWTE